MYTLLPFKLSGVALRRYIITQSGSICFTLALFPSLDCPCKNTAIPLSIAPLIISSSLTSLKSNPYGFLCFYVSGLSVPVFGTTFGIIFGIIFFTTLGTISFEKKSSIYFLIIVVLKSPL